MKVMYKDGITRHVSDATAVRLKALGYTEVKEKKPSEEKEKKGGAGKK